MSKQPSRAFTTAFTSAMSATAIQAARHEVVAKRMSAAATAVIAGLVIGLTGAPAPAHAQNGNAVARSAMDVLGGVVGGAIGSRIGGGNGRKAATVAGAAAGVWAAESMRESSNQSQRNNTMTTNSSSFGPVLGPGWGNTRVPGSVQGSVPSAGYSRAVQSQSAYSRVDSQNLLPSGTTQLSDERMSKLVAMEGTFLAARDAYARTIFASEQAEDDAVLDAGGRGVQEKATATRAQQRKAQSEFDVARGTFVNAVQHLGERGYDVHDFAHSYMLAQARVTANDMNHGDVVRVTRGARIVEHYDDTNSVRESYGSR